MNPPNKIRIDLQAGSPAEQIAKQVEAQRLAQRQLAKARCRQMLKKQPRNLEALQMLTVMMAQDGELEPALKLLDKGVKLHPANAGLHCNRATALEQAGMLEAALEGFARAMAIDPRLFAAHYNQGRVLQRLGRLVDAEAAFRQALTIKPDSPDARASLNALLKASGRPAEHLGAH